MASNHLSSNHAADEDYIDMEVMSSSSSNFFFYSINSPPQTREFEFQKSSISHDRETTTSPADELFYKGKLLPLHLPPRLQMVEKLLQNSESVFEQSKTEAFEEHCTIPFITTSSRAAPSTNTSTPLESCNISPSESCRVSSELNPDEYFFEWSTEVSSFLNVDHPKKSWSKKLKLIKQSSLGQKLKASRAFLKSLFSKSGCTHESCAKAASCSNVEVGKFSEGKECLNKYMKVAKKNSFEERENDDHHRCHISAAVTKRIDKVLVDQDGVVNNSQRRSFSGAIKRHSSTTTKCSSSSSSSGSSSSSSSFLFNLNGFYDLQLLKRSCSANSELESSIEGAIAHCKQSQQLFNSRKTVSEVRFCSLSASRISVCGDQERPGLCSTL